MKLKTAGACLSVVVLAAGVAGCKTSGGGKGGTTTGGLDSSATYAVTADDTAARAISDGKTLKASKTAAATLLDYNANTSRTVDASDFSIKKNANGGVDVTVNGKTTSFAKADELVEGGETAGWERDVEGQDYKLLHPVNGTFDETMNGTGDYRYAQLWRYFLDDGSTSVRGFAAIGAETKPDALKGKANATYKGRATAETQLADDATTRTGVEGDLQLAANFDKGSVSGKMDNLSARTRSGDSGWSPWTPVDGTVTLETAKISGNAYDGKLKGDTAFNTLIDGNLDGSTYSGRFYGPKAEETAGVFKLKGTSEGDGFVGSGGFAAKAQ